MDKLCGTCEFWKPDKSGEVGECEFSGAWWLKLPKTSTFEVFATADDDSNLNCGLTTGSKFGCVHHQKKEEKK